MPETQHVAVLGGSSDPSDLDVHRKIVAEVHSLNRALNVIPILGGSLAELAEADQQPA